MKEVLLMLVPSLITGFITWALTRKKNNAEVGEIGIRAVQGAVEIWKGIADEFRKEVDELKVLVAEYRQENENLREEINQLKTDFHLKN